MKIKLKEFDINSENPFENDLLSRKENAEILTQFVSSIDEPYVIALNSEWGTGKTTFLKMWKCHLELRQFNVIYYNAWENDFNNDPLIPLIDEISGCISDIENPDIKKKTKEYAEKIKSIGFSLVKKTIPEIIKHTTYGIVDLSESVENSFASISETLAKEQFNAYEQNKKSFSEFKKTLQKFSETMANEKPIVFIIDELDRCRPNYAIKLLEKVKHLFSIAGIVFILGIDKQQLGRSVAVHYGNIDVDGYLSRLIDIDYMLPKPDTKIFVEQTLNKHNLSSFFDRRQEYRSFHGDYNAFLDNFSKLFVKFKLTLRQVMQILSQFVLILRLTKKNEYLYPPMLCLLLVIKRTDAKLYEKIRKCDFVPDQIMKELNLDKDLKTFFVHEITAHFELFLKNKNRDYSPQKKYQQLVTDNSENSSIVNKAKEILDVMQKMEFDSPNGGIEFLLTKIELARRFETS